MANLTYPVGLYSLHDDPLLSSLALWSCRTSEPSAPGFTCASIPTPGKTKTAPLSSDVPSPTTPKPASTTNRPSNLPSLSASTISASVSPEVLQAIIPLLGTVSPFDLSIPDAIPSSTGAARRGRGRKRQQKQDAAKYQDSMTCSNTDFSRFAGQVWGALSKEGQEGYRARVNALKEAHSNAYPKSPRSDAFAKGSSKPGNERELRIASLVARELETASVTNPACPPESLSATPSPIDESAALCQTAVQAPSPVLHLPLGPPSPSYLFSADPPVASPVVSSASESFSEERLTGLTLVSNLIFPPQLFDDGTSLLSTPTPSLDGTSPPPSSSGEMSVDADQLQPSNLEWDSIFVGLEDDSDALPISLMPSSPNPTSSSIPAAPFSSTTDSDIVHLWSSILNMPVQASESASEGAISDVNWSQESFEDDEFLRSLLSFTSADLPPYNLCMTSTN
ncbi:hypothetical protein OF83DRAFT_1173548 [Amylostereum chailletii]|nr:hypothetical protein OF83DRAFT_1173548 [Amylostereum chailletii]